MKQVREHASYAPLVLGRETLTAPSRNFAGGFGAFPKHDAHILSTLSAIQILVMLDALDRLDIPRVVSCKKTRIQILPGLLKILAR